MRKRAYLYTRSMVWIASRNNIWGALSACTTNVCAIRAPLSRVSSTEKNCIAFLLSNLITSHRMTDHTGIIEHCRSNVPDYPEGYSTDDNARALIVSILVEISGSEPLKRDLDLASPLLGLSLVGLRKNPITKRLPQLS